MKNDQMILEYINSLWNTYMSAGNAVVAEDNVKAQEKSQELLKMQNFIAIAKRNMEITTQKGARWLFDKVFKKFNEATESQLEHGGGSLYRTKKKILKYLKEDVRELFDTN